jgi:hypothetical protein
MTEQHFSSGDQHEATERTPLVGNGKPPTSPHRPKHQRALSSVASIANIHVPLAHDPNTILTIYCLAIFLIAFSGGFVNIPVTRIFEDALCHQYYDGLQPLDQPIDENLCKVDVIQSDLANLRAVQSAIEAVVCCLATLPWGLVADRLDSFHQCSGCIIATDLVQDRPETCHGYQSVWRCHRDILCDNRGLVPQCAAHPAILAISLLLIGRRWKRNFHCPPL